MACEAVVPDIYDEVGQGMTVYTYSDARRKLASLLETASVEGEVRIKRWNGEEFVVRPTEPSGSPLDVEGVDLEFTADEIVESVRTVLNVQRGRRIIVF